jgi:putative ABC transport system permease protein
LLKIKSLKKTYGVDKFVTKAVNRISIEFRESEFVCILGPSGCGKSTFLNLIGALDKPNSGEIYIQGNPLSDFNDDQLDQYRNNSLGFIFQTHNLIKHLNALENIEMGMSLSGVYHEERRARALELLEEVGLSDHAMKRPNQLSVGQGQRIAIARAVANNPDIILADEPTGSVDSETAVQIMELINKVSQGKLVIMVTHDEELAAKYATRIVRLLDGKIVSDSNPYKPERKKRRKKELNLKKTFINFKTSFISAVRNLKYKVGRTLATIFASSVGIVGLSLTFALSTGTNREIKRFENEVLGHYPINISSNYAAQNVEYIPIPELPDLENLEDGVLPSIKEPQPMAKTTNKITPDFVDYVTNYYQENDELFSGFLIRPRIKHSFYTRGPDTNGKLYNLKFHSDIEEYTSPLNQKHLIATQLPEKNIVYDLYDLIAGEKPEVANDPDNKTFGVLLVTNKFNEIDASFLIKLRITHELGVDVPFEDIIGTEILYLPGEYQPLTFDHENAIKLVITGIVRIKNNGSFPIFNSGIVYTKDLITYVENNYPEFIYSTDYIDLYPSSLEAKTEIMEYLNNYNVINGFDENHPNYLKFTDESSTLSTLSNTAINAATLGLIGFSFISLAVASVMIAVITYTSVVERTNEIGILRALGARKRDIARIFNSENIMIGVLSGLFGTATSHILTYPLNRIVEKLLEIEKIFIVNPLHILLALVVAVLVGYVSGLIPSRMAANKIPVEALREKQF